MEDHGPSHHTIIFYERRRGGVTDWICLGQCENYKPLGRRYRDRFVPRVPGHRHVWEKGWNDHGGLHVATHEVDICIATCGTVVHEEPPRAVRHGMHDLFAWWKRWCAYCSIHSASDASTCRRCRNLFPEDARFNERLPHGFDDPALRDNDG